MRFVKISVERQNYGPRCHGIGSRGGGVRRSSLTSVVLQEHDRGVDDCRGGVGGGWLANWCEGEGIGASTGRRNFV